MGQHNSHRVPLAADHGLNHYPSLHEPPYPNDRNSKDPYGLEKDILVDDGPYIRARSLRQNSGNGDAVSQRVTQPEHECALLAALPRTLSDRIPLDVIAQIASHLDPEKNETRTILSMATVCTSWYPTCQRKLYRDITLRSWDGYIKLATLALNCTNVRRQLECTRSLHVGGPKSSGLETPCLPSFPLVLAGLLPSLRRLHMCNLRPPFHPSFYRALPKLGTVTDLILSDVFVNNIHDLRRILCGFPHLRHLTIGHISYSRPVSSTGLASCKIPEISVPCRARLQTLSLDWGSDHHLFVCLIRWLIDASVCTDLTSFEVMSSVHPLNGRFMIYDYLDLFMESIGPSVRRLVVAPEGAYATCC